MREKDKGRELENYTKSVLTERFKVLKGRAKKCFATFLKVIQNDIYNFGFLKIDHNT